MAKKVQFLKQHSCGYLQWPSLIQRMYTVGISPSGLCLCISSNNRAAKMHQVHNLQASLCVCVLKKAFISNTVKMKTVLISSVEC